MSYSYKIVVSRFNENIDWLQSNIDNCIIYNKGSPLEGKLYKFNEIMLDNVGREAQTYLHYIITQYDNLPDIVIFTQACISDHRGADTIDYLLQMKYEAIKYGGISIPYGAKDDLGILWAQWNINNDFMDKLIYKNNKVVAFDEWFKVVIDSSYPKRLYQYPNALFAVKKDLILQNSLEYYNKLIKEVDYSNAPAEGHLFERAWYYIFKKNDYTEYYIDLYSNQLIQQ